MHPADQLPRLDGAAQADAHTGTGTPAAPHTWTTSWLFLALASGAFAALNGVFAKL